MASCLAFPCEIVLHLLCCVISAPASELAARWTADLPPFTAQNPALNRPKFLATHHQTWGTACAIRYIHGPRTGYATCCTGHRVATVRIKSQSDRQNGRNIASDTKFALQLQYYDTSRLFVSSCESQLLLMFVPLTHRLCRTISSLMLCFLCRKITPNRWFCRRIFGGVSQRCRPFRGIDRVSCVFESTSTKLQLNRFLV